MKAAPACFIAIFLLSSGLLFSQQNVSINKLKITENNQKISEIKLSKLTKKNTITNTSASTPSTDKTKKDATKTKATLEMSKTKSTEIPRTTLDFY